MEDILFNPDNRDFIPVWTAINSVAATFSMIALIATIIFTRKGIQESFRSFQATLETSHYSELDRMYFELLKASLEKPYLTNPAALKDDTQLKAYEIYAYMIWNFLEAIHDRCKGDKVLEATWYPVIDAENRLHSKWFQDKKNWHKFKEPFRKFIEREEFKSQACTE
jgi:hypothetical protein